MKLLAFLLVFVLVFAGVAAYQLEQKGLLTRETLDMLMRLDQKEEEKTLINAEPVGLAASLIDSRHKLGQQARDLEVLNERLDAQRYELDEQRAAVEKRIKELRTEQERLGAERADGLLREGALNEKQTRLLKMYQSMPPDEVANLLGGMPAETVAVMLLQMRDRQSARIMEELDEAKAAEVARLLWAENEAKEMIETGPVATP